MKRDIDICYLCGKKLGDDVTRDHVPPKQFYAKNIRKKHKPTSLLTLPVHTDCNISYEKDELYFTHSIGCAAQDSYSGQALWRDLSSKYKKPRGKRIAKMIFQEFDRTPSGIILPFGKVAKNFDGERVWRVVWKITRGLFFWETGRFLPEYTANGFKITSPNEEPPKEFAYVVNAQSRGQYPGVFDYKYIVVSEFNNFNFWAMLFWDRIIMLISFHDPECPCETCKKIRNDASDS